MTNVDALITDEENLVRNVGYNRRTCASCLHWAPFNGVMMNVIEKTSHRTYALGLDGGGKCLRFPPTLTEDGWAQPKTTSGDSCGEWEIREFDGKQTQLRGI